MKTKIIRRPPQEIISGALGRTNLSGFQAVLIIHPDAQLQDGDEIVISIGTPNENTPDRR